jgi:hypothetical protein
VEKNDVVDFVRKALPWIGAAATGNVPVLATMAAKAVSDALGVNVDATPSAVAKAVANATPEDLLKLKESEQNFALQMQTLNYKNETELYASEVTDRNGARDREVKVGDNTNRILALVIILAWVSIQWFLMTHVIDVSMRELVARVLGTLDAALTMVLAYYFGSSRGSDRKTELLGTAQK